MNHGSKLQIERRRILEDVQDSSRQCEDRFRGRTELATEFDKRVVRLCQVLEEAFTYGLKKRRGIIKITKDIASKGLSKGGSNSESNSHTFWHFVGHFLNKQEHERYLLLKNVTTDLGRARAWMRSSLNENSLQRYLMAMFDSAVSSRISHYYEDWSILSSPDHRHILLDAAKALSGILFAINIDRLDLDAASEVEDSASSRVRESKDPEPVFPSLSSSPSSSNSSPAMAIRRTTPRFVSLADDDDDKMSNGTQSPYSSTPTNPESFLSSRNPQLLLTPLEEDTRSIASSGEKHAVLPPSEDNEFTGSDEIHDEDFDHHHDGNITDTEDLLRKLQEMKEEKARIEILLSSTQKSLEEKLKVSESTISSLSTENDILKVQVKKYLSAIQMLNSPSEEKRTMSPETSKESHPETLPSYVVYQEAQEYEKKLIQVAEMHGELVEFNDRLHRVILQKEAIIKRLREELVELRGPLPEGVEVGELDDISSVSEASIVSTVPSLHRPLVNIWIPTAFLAGQHKSSSHHVYQVYVRIKDEEWNVYRRYSQFYDMNCKLSKKYPIISTFDFPPKKTFSKRDARVVQERRKRLESFLRSVVNVIQAEHDVTDRSSLTMNLPFLGLSDNRRISATSRDSEGTVPNSTVVTSPPQQYMGL